LLSTQSVLLTSAATVPATPVLSNAVQSAATMFIRGACGAVVTTSILQALNTVSNAAVNLESRSRITWVNPRPASARSAVSSRASCVAQAAVGNRVTPSSAVARWTLRNTTAGGDTPDLDEALDDALPVYGREGIQQRREPR
jgi:hypothetical protein